MTPTPTIAEMSWVEYSQHITTRNPIVLIPVGSLEQHGPHLPLATDVLLPTAICDAAAHAVGGLVAPALPYGYKSFPRSGGGQHFCGTTSLDASTLIAQIIDLVREFTRHGVTRIAFIVGHLENIWFVNEACDLAYRTARDRGTAVKLMRANYWEFLNPGTVTRVFGDSPPDWPLEHAGIMETSLMLHLHPDLVHMDRLEPQRPADLPLYDTWPYDTARVPASGILCTAQGASAQLGKIFFEEYVAGLTAALRHEFP